MSELLEVRELHLRGPDGGEIDLSSASAILIVEESRPGQWEWSIHVQTNQILNPNVSSYVAHMVTDDGQLLNGTVLFSFANTTSQQDNVALLEGSGPLNGYDLAK